MKKGPSWPVVTGPLEEHADGFRAELLGRLGFSVWAASRHMYVFADVSRWLLAEALRLAWREGIARVHVHTCTLDHPAALGAYRRAGFVPYKRAVERFHDPRLLGILPRSCAPQVPLFGTETSSPPWPES